MTQRSAFYIPILHKALIAMLRIAERRIVSRSRMRLFIIQLRAAIRGAPLPPGSLGLLQQEFNAGQRFLLKRAQALGPIFKVNLNGAYTTCVLGHELAMRLLASNEDRLPGELIDLRRLFPIGFLREMTGETHQRYRRLFIQAMQATPLSVHQDDSERIIRDGLAALAQAPPPVAGDVIRDRLRHMTSRIMFRVLFGLSERSPGFRELEASYRRFRRFDSKPPVFTIQDEHACAFAEITATLRQMAQDLPRDTNRGHSACFLRHLAECGALDDEALLGNLAYMFSPSHFDLYSLWHWVLILLATHPEISSAFTAKLDTAARRQYAEAIVLETLRMEQSEYLHRRVTGDIVFDGFLIPAGTRLRVCIWEGHKDKTAFPDPFTFDPSRFLGQRHGPQKFAPFGLGQHHCVGASLVVGLSTLFVQTLLEGYTLVATEAGPVHRGTWHWQPSPDCAIRLVTRVSRSPSDLSANLV